MRFFLIILGYIFPAILATKIIELLNKHKIIDSIIDHVKEFNLKNSGPVYDFIKTTFILIFMILGILLFLFILPIGLIGGIEIGNLLINSNYLNAVFLIILTTFADIILFCFMDKS